MGLNLNGSTESVTVSTTADLAGFDFRFGTIAILLSLTSIPASNSGLFVTNGGVGTITDFYVAGTGSFLGWYDGANFRESTIAVPTGEPVIVVAVKATGTATARMHMYKFSNNTWTHGNTSGTNVNSAANTSFCFGENTGTIPLFADLFQAAIWTRPTFATDNSCERLAKISKLDWPRLDPEFCWRFADHRQGLGRMRSLGRFRTRETSRIGTRFGTIPNPGGFGSLPTNRRR